MTPPPPPSSSPHTCVRVPAGVDTTRASIARVYDASLGGKDNYDVDRAALGEVLKIAPHQGQVSRMNRAWLQRVVRYLAGRVGIDQFLDIGAGLPTVLNTHDIAQSENAEAEVVYVDNDPVCNAHGRVLLEQNDYTHFVPGDLTKPDELLHPDGGVAQFIDFTRPVGLILAGILHHVDDGLDPPGIMRRYVETMPPGSHLAISHFWDPADKDPQLHELARDLEHQFTHMGLGSGWYRTHKQILDYFDGLKVLGPGLVRIDDWWPAGPAVVPRPPEALMLGGVAVKHRAPASDLAVHDTA